MRNDPVTPADPLLTGQQAARYVSISYSGFYRAISEGRMPQPCYPAERAPRWYQSELDAAVRATRQLPAVALAERRARRLAERKALRRKRKSADAAVETVPAA